jgi:hypothetical protein
MPPCREDERANAIAAHVAASKLPTRDADWVEAEWAAGRSITGQRIHLTRNVTMPMTGVSISNNHITFDTKE